MTTMQTQVTITAPIRRAYDEGHRGFYWEYLQWEYRLVVATGHHENGRWITRTVWKGERDRAEALTALLKVEYEGLDLSETLRQAELREAACGGERL